MINVKESVHVNTTIVSLKQSMKKASIYGEIRIDDLYLLNTIYDLLNTMCLNLSNDQRKRLITAYNKLAFKSKDVCTNVMLKAFAQPMKSKSADMFIDPDCVVKNTNVNIWKSALGQTYDEIIETLNKTVIENTSHISRLTAQEGFYTSITGIGKQVFFINTSNNLNISIIDALNNNVTENFDIGYIPTLNGVLVVSKYDYNSTPLFLKIV